MGFFRNFAHESIVGCHARINRKEAEEWRGHSHDLS